MARPPGAGGAAGGATGGCRRLGPRRHQRTTFSRADTNPSISSRVRRSVTATSRPSPPSTHRPGLRRRPAPRPGNPRRPSGRSTVSAGTGRRRANSRRVGAGASRDTPGYGQRRLPGVPGAPGAAQGQLAQPGGAQPRQLDHGRHRDQGLVGADVRRGLLPANVLLPGPQRGDVGRPTLGVDGPADQAAGQAAHLFDPAGEQPQVRSAEGQRGAERLPLPDHHVGAVLARAPAAARPTPGSKPTTSRASVARRPPPGRPGCPRGRPDSSATPPAGRPAGRPRAPRTSR